MNKFVFALLIFAFATTMAQAQHDTLTLLNGKQIAVATTSVDSINDEFVYITPKGNEKRIDLNAVFSLNATDGSQQLLYKQSADYFDLSASQLQSYVSGQVYARQTVHTLPHFGAGLVLGGLSPYVVHRYWYPVVPLVCGIGVGYTFPVGKRQKPYLATQDTDFVRGYREMARKKKIQSTLLGVITGVVAGSLTYFYTNN